LPVSAEFLHFHGMLQYSVLAGDNGANTTSFGRVQATIDN